MSDFFHSFALAFIPLFVAMDAPGMAPLFVSLTDGLTEKSRNALVSQATLTALIIAIVFLVLGNAVFRFLGITPADFRIAGGILLVILAITDLLFSQHETRRAPDGPLGIVPIGIPLIMGPAAMTTLLISLHKFGSAMTTLSLAVNLLIVWLTFRFAPRLIKLVGDGGAKAVAKVASLFLAAIGVMMIRVGIMEIAKNFG